MFGRQPISPIDAVMTKTQWIKTANYPEYVKRAEKVSAELKALASENDRIAKQVRNRYHNTIGKAPQFKQGGLSIEEEYDEEGLAGSKISRPL